MINDKLALETLVEVREGPWCDEAPHSQPGKHVAGAGHNTTTRRATDAEAVVCGVRAGLQHYYPPSFPIHPVVTERTVKVSPDDGSVGH